MTPPTENFLAKLQTCLADRSFVRLTLSRPVAGNVEKVIGRLIDLRGEFCLSLTSREPTRDTTRNLPCPKVLPWARSQLGARFRSALLHTTNRDWQLQLPAASRARLVGHRPAFTAAPPRSHDEPKRDPLAAANDWLHGLDVTDAGGKIRAAMADKHRQISRYLEILGHLAKDCGWLTVPSLDPLLHPAPVSAVPSPSEAARTSLREDLTFVDMGCGKGYLTFGAWHLFRRIHHRAVRVVGVEAQPALVQFTTDLARRMPADGLSFLTGTIGSVDLPRADALIALHACDTATDDAILRGIQLGAKLIVVAPCCQKELRPQLGRPEPFAAVLRHGILEERLAEWLTDGLRALFLEWAGYQTKVFEFISAVHTPKNLMIAAIRKGRPFHDKAARKRVVELKRFFGVARHALDPLLATA